jgi:sarcosine oxidase subunit gamma
MVENYMRQSALAHLGLKARQQPTQPTGVELAELQMPGQIGLRLDSANKTLVQIAEKALGLPLAIAPNTVTKKGKKSTLWLGPDEWLVLVPPATTEKLKNALAGHHAAVFDVSDSRVVISLSGTNARDVLKKGCGLDLHKRVFGPGQCASSTLAMAHVLIHQSAPNAYRLFVHRSFSAYLWAWLEDASGEYGVRVNTA